MVDRINHIWLNLSPMCDILKQPFIFHERSFEAAAINPKQMVALRLP